MANTLEDAKPLPPRSPACTGVRFMTPSLLHRVIDRFRRDNDLSKPSSPEALSLTLSLRRLWSDHVVWTREYVVAAISDAPDAGAAAGRLLKNQESATPSSPSTATQPAAGSPSC